MEYEIRERSLGQILDTGFRLLANHFALLVGLSFLVALPAQLLALFLLSAAEGGQDAVIPLASGLILLLAYIILLPIVYTAITWALAELYQGRSASIADSLRTALGIFLPIVGTSLVSTLVVIVGFLLLVLPGLYLAFAFLIVFQVAVIERVFAVSALKRSRELMSGNLLRGLGLMVVVGLLSVVLSTGVELTLGLIPTAGALASALVTAVTTAFQSAVLTVLYFDLRCRKEAFDLEHLARAVEQQGA